MTEVTFKTSAEIAEEKRQAELQRQHEQREIEQRERRNADLAEQAKDRQREHERQQAIEAEETAAQRGRELAARLQDSRNEVETLRAAITTEREGKELSAELEAAERGIASRGRLAETPVAEVERLTRLKLLASLWPQRKAVLAERLATAEADVARLTKELADTQSLFAKASAAVKKLMGREGATA
jgi:hypothetical protein